MAKKETIYLKGEDRARASKFYGHIRFRRVHLFYKGL